MRLYPTAEVVEGERWVPEGTSTERRRGRSEALRREAWPRLELALRRYWLPDTDPRRRGARDEVAEVGYWLAHVMARRVYRDELEREEARWQATHDVLVCADRVAAGLQESPEKVGAYARTVIVRAVLRRQLQTAPSWQQIEDEVRDLANGLAPDARFAEWWDDDWQCWLVGFSNQTNWSCRRSTQRRQLSAALEREKALLQAARASLKLHRRKFRSKVAAAMAVLLVEARCPLPQSFMVEAIGKLLGVWRRTTVLLELDIGGPGDEERFSIDGVPADKTAYPPPEASASSEYIAIVARALRGDPAEWKAVRRKPPSPAEWACFVLRLEKWVREELFACMGGPEKAAAASGWPRRVLAGPPEAHRCTYSDLEIFDVVRDHPPFCGKERLSKRQRCLLVADVRRNLRDRLKVFIRCYLPAKA